MKLIKRGEFKLELHMDERDIDAQIEVIRILDVKDPEMRKALDHYLNQLQLTRAGYPKHLL